jgi:hypothetical protein
MKQLNQITGEILLGFCCLQKRSTTVGLITYPAGPMGEVCRETKIRETGGSIAPMNGVPFMLDPTIIEHYLLLQGANL